MGGRSEGEGGYGELMNEVVGQREARVKKTEEGDIMVSPKNRLGERKRAPSWEGNESEKDK